MNTGPGPFDGPGPARYGHLEVLRVWWWTVAGSVVLLLVLGGVGVLAGPVPWLAVPAWAVSMLALAVLVVERTRGLDQPVEPPPEGVAAAMRRAGVRQRMAAMRAARRGETVHGPLAQASAWYRDHRFTVGALRPLFGLALMVLPGSLGVGFLVVSGVENVLVAFWAVFAAISIATTVVGLAMLRPVLWRRPGLTGGGATEATS